MVCLDAPNGCLFADVKPPASALSLPPFAALEALLSALLKASLFILVKALLPSPALETPVAVDEISEPVILLEVL